MFLPTYVLDWRVNGDKRVRGFHTFDDFYLLNTNRMFEIKQGWVDDHSLMFFFDNPANCRDGGAHMRIHTSVAGIIGMADLDHGSEAVTLDTFPDDFLELYLNGSPITTTALTLAKASIAYAYPADDAWSAMWVVYIDAGWNVKRILVHHGAFVLWVMLET
jgi:hypothetical protein